MKTKQVFNIMNVVSWIVFIAYCIKAGAITIVALISLFGNKKATENLYLGIDLSNLYEFSVVHYAIAVLLFVVITCIKAYIFYLLIIALKTLDLKKPFKTEVVNLVFKISYAALVVGLLGVFTKSYFTWLNSKVFFVQLDLGASAYIFMAGVVFMIATLFKRALEIQSENELTI